MSLFSLEHSRAAYRADFALYGTAVVVLAALLLGAAPRPQAAVYAACAVAGLAAWTFLEYVLHRFVLHGMPPFSRWHADHHARPTALICAPTVLSATLIVVLVFVPGLLLGDAWRACALTFGVLTGYLAYAVTHHATHHWRGDGAWLRRRKRWHALHHHATRNPVAFGVTSSVWDHVFGSDDPGATTRRRRAA
jgi:sterol desaturase/sphingolipid hydroxylase (fatty acid hydroxylase superfamily)